MRRLLTFLSIPVALISVVYFLYINNDTKTTEVPIENQYFESTLPTILQAPTQLPASKNVHESTRPNLDKNTENEQEQMNSIVQDSTTQDLIPITTTTVTSIPPTPTTTETTTTTSPPPTKKSCKIETNVNYPGGDLAGVKAETNDECCELCLNLDECKAYAFLEKGKYCYLKNIEPKPEQSVSYDGITYGIIIES